MLQCKQCTTRLISSVAKFFRLHCSSVLCDNVNFTEYFSRVPKNPLWVFSGTFKILDDTAGSKNVTTGSNQHHECNMFISFIFVPAFVLERAAGAADLKYLTTATNFSNGPLYWKPERGRVSAGTFLYEIPCTESTANAAIRQSLTSPEKLSYGRLCIAL